MIKNSKLLIVDDEGVIAEHLKVILESMDFTNIFICNDKESTLEYLENHNPDLVLLDIRMKHELDGIEIAQFIINERTFPFIFITAHSDSEIVQKALATKPAAYITKPFKKVDVLTAIEIALVNKLENESSAYLIFKDGYDDVRILFDSIIYVESEGNYIDIITDSKRFTLRKSLLWFEENSSKEQFVRIHRSYLINRNKILKLSSLEVTLSSISLPVSRKYLNDLRTTTFVK